MNNLPCQADPQFVFCTERERRAARRGRSPIEELEEEAADETDNKRIRMRRAQRAYRTRKEEILVSEKARSEQLSKALDDAMETFISFLRHVYEFHQTRHSPGLLFHLNQAFMQI
ncbi:hypothetical protein F9C07_250 [Aspergillus flavus]|uniref:BZIP domain-containing protein n=1 Tax=Aspergillus flavus (strain ATCC 200026 / FGSC A1120 / IAM 13836 / NRRL 3357 / JCM 12722 / SRRC 167) TaxID=332952 RepID=A0A7U2MP25_ASPFN|nr:hypothetical protein AFLA_003017 [Aspergillus flavus NRRL3357]QRD87262.1 hypothetical protein F9C07_250 [Aspergillus flavus]